MALTAATMTAIATSLRGAATAHGRHASTIGAAITATGTAVDAVDPMWRGPSTETAMATARAFLTDVADVSTIVEDAQAVLDELAAFADEVAAELSSAEATLSRVSPSSGSTGWSCPTRPPIRRSPSRGSPAPRRTGRGTAGGPRWPSARSAVA